MRECLKSLAKVRGVVVLAVVIVLLSPMFASRSFADSSVARFVGVWQFVRDPTHTLSVEQDGTFVMKTGNPPYVFFTSGRLVVRGNQVTFEIEDWSPKQDISGRAISKPASGTATFEFPTADSLNISGGIYRRR